MRRVCESCKRRPVRSTAHGRRARKGVSARKHQTLCRQCFRSLIDSLRIPSRQMDFEIVNTGQSTIQINGMVRGGPVLIVSRNGRWEFVNSSGSISQWTRTDGSFVWKRRDGSSAVSSSEVESGRPFVAVDNNRARLGSASPSLAEGAKLPRRYRFSGGRLGGAPAQPKRIWPY